MAYPLFVPEREICQLVRILMVTSNPKRILDDDFIELDCGHIVQLEPYEKSILVNTSMEVDCVICAEYRGL